MITAVALPVDEAVYYVEKSRQAAILVSSNAMELGRAIVAKINHSQDEAIECIAIAPNIVQSAVSLKEIVVSSGSYTDDNSAGCLIFTSGTSGSPKPAVLPRGYIHEAARGVADHFDLRPGDVILHVLPVHHVTGLVINILPFIMAGACIEFRSGSFDPQWIWDRWRKGGLTFFSGVPTIFLRMMRYHQQVISKLPTAERTAYEEAADQFRAIICGTSALPRPVQDFWTRIRKGKPILTRYGSTEAGAVLMVPLEGESVPDGSVGRVVPGVDLKLSEGEEGEILIKSPHLFSRYLFLDGVTLSPFFVDPVDRYLFDEAATANAFDERGYFKTGDIARREGENYFISGRASQDIIKSGGYKISALDIEREVLALPYISEVMVVGVEDEEFGQRVAALVTLLDGTRPEQSLSINGFRGDLRSKLAGYKLPTLLRIVKGDLPKTASGKVLKKKLGLKFFPCPGWEQEPQIQVWRSGSSKL